MAEKSRRGFAAMDAEKQREIARKGGVAAHARGTAHQFTPAEAQQAGRRGGLAVSQDRAHMAEIGRRGGQHSPTEADDAAVVPTRRVRVAKTSRRGRTPTARS